jgi:hypothetical protein
LCKTNKPKIIKNTNVDDPRLIKNTIMKD